MTEIAGRVAVITGGASGIGRGIAEELIAQGASVVISDVEREALQATAAEIGAVAVPADVSSLESVEALRDAALARFDRVDIVVNNAGVGPWGEIETLTMDDWRWVLDVNLYGVIHGVHVFLPVLHANSEGGHIVNTSSMAAFDPQPQLAAYSVTKFGIAALTEVLNAEERAKGGKVRATLLAPGMIRTNINSSTRNRPAGSSGALHDNAEMEQDGSPALQERWMTPREVGAVVARAIRNDDEYAITHPDWWWRAQARFKRIEEAFARYPVWGSEPS